MPRSERLANALGGWNLGYPADPYGDPCVHFWRVAETSITVDPRAKGTNVEPFELIGVVIRREFHTWRGCW